MGISCFYWIFKPDSSDIGSITNRAYLDEFATGELSLANANFLSNALWPPLLAMARVAPGKPMWNSAIGPFCAAPECNFETFFSFSMGPHWHTIVLGTPAEAEATLKEVGLNYFAINTNERFFDILPYSPLFSPNNIGRYLGVIWSRDGVYLLTWRSSKTRPLPKAFFAGYAHSMDLASTSADFKAMYDVLAASYRQWEEGGQKWPARVPSGVALPRGWQ
jgi:hypothetical protein